MYGLLTLQLSREATIKGKLGIPVNAKGAFAAGRSHYVRRVNASFYLISAYLSLTDTIHLLTSRVIPDVSSPAH